MCIREDLQGRLSSFKGQKEGQCGWSRGASLGGGEARGRYT